MTASFEAFIAQIKGVEAAPLSGFLSFSGQLDASQLHTLTAALKASTVTGISLAGVHSKQCWPADTKLKY